MNVKRAIKRKFWNTGRKTYRQGRKPMKFGANGFEVVEFERIQNPKLHPLIPNWDFDARLAGEQRFCLHWLTGSRLELQLEITPCRGGGVSCERGILRL
ncbi:hypothetical protein AVEN_39934-1 [Araneus ventricosus]|uniref:Uncharacterized protein n=1 Tax=Araneus ventricosus TaxID=182803 RepID=A0A4Y2G3L8_ARAVE|nr:hypothetical protein AVEN_39934-1 [Araneus ventricosus]